MNDRFRNIIVGLTALMAVLGMGLMMLLFGYAPAWLETGYPVSIEMNNASGLTKGSRVRLSGKDVGRIDSVDLAVRPRWGVDVVAVIREEVSIPRDVRISVESQLLGGSPALTFQPPIPGVDAADEFLATDGSARIVLKHDVPTLLSQFAAELQSALKASVNDLRAELERAQGNFESLSRTWIQVGRNIDELTKPRQPDEVDGDTKGATMGNLSTVLILADRRLRELEAVIAGMQKWVGNEPLRTSVNGLVSNANHLTKKMGSAVDRLVEVADGAGDSLNALAGRFVIVADELSTAIRTLRLALDKARQGEGTAGKLMKDPALYDNLNDAAERLDRALKEIRMLVEKWQTEGLPVKF